MTTNTCAMGFVTKMDQQVDESVGKFLSHTVEIFPKNIKFSVKEYGRDIYLENLHVLVEMVVKMPVMRARADIPDVGRGL